MTIYQKNYYNDQIENCKNLSSTQKKNKLSVNKFFIIAWKSLNTKILSKLLFKSQIKTFSHKKSEVKEKYLNQCFAKTGQTNLFFNFILA